MKIIVLSILLLVATISQAQLKCFYSNTYTTKISSEKDKAIKSDILVCYNATDVCFYTKELGTKTYQIESPIAISKNSDGDTVRTMAGSPYYIVSTTQGKDKITVVINSVSWRSLYLFSTDKFEPRVPEALKDKMTIH